MKTWANTSTRHGTSSGWSFHKKLRERPCDACYRAKSDYDSRHRLASDGVKSSRLAARAQGRASQELRHRYPDEYQKLYVRFKKQLAREMA